jgi:Ca-activated chloride channel family protein
MRAQFDVNRAKLDVVDRDFVARIDLELARLTLSDADGSGRTLRASDLLPAKIPDLFEGDQLVLLGKYAGKSPLRFRLSGQYQGKPRTFEFTFQLDKATNRNSFVPRLWASRKIAMLIEEIRQAGAEKQPSVLSASAKADPKMKELVDEIVRLSTEFGILTEYTAFLAKEGTDLSGRNQILEEANRNLVVRAQATRSGIGAVNQAFNGNFQQSQVRENRRYEFYDQNMNRVQVSRVQQINDRAFFQQGNRWIDGNAINSSVGAAVERTVTVGSPEFLQLLDKLTAENRQGTLSMSGEILLRIDGRNILIKGN